MQAIYNGHSRKSGIYQIINKINGKVYIGSAKEFKRRYTQHINSLKKGTHHNKHLQGAFNRDGSDSFEFHVLKVVEGEQADRLLVEQTHIDKLQDSWETCYNFKQQTVATTRSCFSKDPDATRVKKSEASIGMWKDPTYRKLQSEIQSIKTQEQWENIEHRESKIEGMKSFHLSEESVEHKQKIASRMRNRTVSSETRVKISKAVSKANKELWKNKTYREKVINGRKESWKKDEERKKKASEKMRKSFQKTYLVVAPDGTIVNITNMQKFCTEYDGKLIPHEMSKVARGTKKTYKGWTTYCQK